MKIRYLPLGRRNQITLPKEAVAEGVSLYRYERKKDGTIVLVPQIAVDASQAYFWTKRWQEGERQADEDIKSGRVSKPMSAAEILAELDAQRKKRKK